MELPILLPKDLDYVGIATDDRILLNLLVKIPQDLNIFFQYACDDETWSSKHTYFMKNILLWLTDQFFQDRWLWSFAQSAAQSIREHIHILEPLLPLNLTILYDKGRSAQVNSLLWGTGSDYLHTLIRQECRDKKKTILEVPELPEDVFPVIQEYLNSGNVKELWRKREPELIPILSIATEWGLSGLMELTEDILKKYMTLNNVCDRLIDSHENKWIHLRNACIEFINELNAGVHLDPEASEFSFEFLDFREKALSYFEKLREHIERLVISRNLTENPEFSTVIHQCPRMKCLDISRSESFSDRFVDIPNTLEDLDVDKCAWLSNANIAKLLEICPNLTKISLASNTQITYSGWSALQKLRHLQSLDISRCFQITDEEFKLIMQASRMVTHLHVQECTKLTDQAFYELGRNMPKLTDLDLSRCNISDVALSSLVAHCRQLVTLTLVRCPKLTDRGIAEAARNAPFLQVLNITKCSMTPDTLDEIKKLRPYLTVIF